MVISLDWDHKSAKGSLGVQGDGSLLFGTTTMVIAIESDV
jgi:hypothetical protein